VLGEDIAGGWGNRYRASEVKIHDAPPDTWAQCPDYECAPCKGKHGRDACPHHNFTGVRDIICVFALSTARAAKRVGAFASPWVSARARCARER
jgi:hypothetical protein